jgi:hypothetical protein
MSSFVPEYATPPLEHFEPLVRGFFKEERLSQRLTAALPADAGSGTDPGRSGTTQTMPSDVTGGARREQIHLTVTPVHYN